MGWGRNLYELVRIPIRRPCKGYYLRWYYNGWHYWFFLPGSYSVQTEGEAYKTIGTRQIQMSSGQIDRGQAQAIRTIMNTREVYLLTIAGWMNIRLIPGSIIVYDNRQNGVEIDFTAIIGSKEISYDTGFTPVPGDGSVPDIPIVPPSTDYCEIIIGNQIWMCSNYNSNFPGSFAYQNNEAYADIYGRLYNWTMLTTPGFAPEGWHVPTLADWNELFDFVGGIGLAGGELKEAGLDHWNPPNTDAIDTYGLALLPGGLITNYSSILVNQAGFFWTFTEQNYNQSLAVRALYNSGSMITYALSKYGNDYASVRLIKDEALPFDAITIGTQTWALYNVSDNLVGSRVYNDNEANRAIYGGLYSYNYIAEIEALYPGWHVPTKAEWDTLSAYLGGDAVSGGHLKQAGIVLWANPNNADNSSGFTALPGGYYGGAYNFINTLGVFMTSTLFDATHFYFKRMINNATTLVEFNTGSIPALDSFSVRLIKD